ncbi:malate:quinone oxidoreductase [Albibacterium profundi]|uniref:Probable malate:quinone oxidoreductase n=1 Tax=Albibacterium profundi TaxID=3134906 RepID=A0ABV5CES1_9SPHI
MTKKNKNNAVEADIVLIGAGIMSATLGTLLKQLMPDATIQILERLDEVAAESSDAWNNAGTGHSALCELNYTPEQPDGSIKIDKAINIAESFEVSKQFWSSLVEEGLISMPDQFIRSIPHMSFVIGKKNVSFLKKRYDTMQENHLFKGMVYTENKEQLKEWIPLVMDGRDSNDHVAATRMEIGTDVNFGALTRAMLQYLWKQKGVALKLAHEVQDIERGNNGRWNVEVKNLTTKRKKVISAKFVFIGAGGGSLLLLEKSDIPEAKGFGGFPVGGQWLKCINPEVIKRHHAKVYGKAAVGAPPMSVPHLDTRFIDGKQALLFGPYAGFSTKFLKNGSYFDLATSIKIGNIRPLLAAGWDNIPLTKYLISEVMQSPEDRMKALRQYMPEAKQEDWELEIAGQRVQVIKKDAEHGGKLEFGTEVVTSADGSLSALLGASPGASTAVSIMIDVLARCFPEQMKEVSWKKRLQQLIPSYGYSLAENEELTKKMRARSAQVLDLNVTEQVDVK